MKKWAKHIHSIHCCSVIVVVYLHTNVRAFIFKHTFSKYVSFIANNTSRMSYNVLYLCMYINNNSQHICLQ